jgi:D-beta-D-heptose 7-phosphate kinase/D-beta-D-heptose 1-phosphate adenosyltransferase
VTDLIPDDLSALQPRVHQMSGKAVLVVGDIMLDKFVYGDVHRISPESPVPVLSVKRETLMLGGSGNVLSNLAGLGVKALVVGLVGDDVEGEKIRTLMSERGCDPSMILTAEDRPTTVKTRFLASNQQLLRTDYERTTPVAEGLERQIIALAEKAMQNAHAVILSDYGKGTLTKAVIQDVIRTAHKQGIPILVDPKAKDFAIYKGADIVTPNKKELSDAIDMPTGTDDEVVAAAQALIDQSGIKSVVATRSQDGITILQKGNPVHLKTEALEVFDVSGAGDTVIATIAAGLAAGANLYEAAAIANFAAGVVVGKVGTAPIRREELLSALARGDKAIVKDGQRAVTFDRVRQAGLASWDEAAEQVARWRARGLKVGFTNGAFDILHSGHVTYLNQARSRCDRLVVGLNCDDSIRRYKSKDRPINDEDSRARVLGALGSVDLVVMFGRMPDEKDTPLKLIQKLGPDLLVKGADYTIDQVVGADYVISTGGEVWLAPLEEGKSTTNVIKKMKGEAA